MIKSGIFTFKHTNNNMYNRIFLATVKVAVEDTNGILTTIFLA